MPTEKLYVEKLKDGRFQYRLRYVDKRTGKAHRVSCIKNSNSRQAYNSALRELQNRAVEAPYSRLKLNQGITLYLEDKTRSVRPQTLRYMRFGLNAVSDVIGDLYLDELTVMDVKKAISSISEHNHTYNERLRRVKAFLRWCFQNELIKDNMADRLPLLPDNRKERIQDKYLEPEELRALLDGMIPMWYYLTYFLVLSGLRIGEAFALELDDIGEYIRVNKSYSISIRELGETKTDNSTREVYVQPELKSLLDQYLIFRQEYLNGRKSKLLFPGREGYMKYNAYNKYLHQTSRKVLGREITPHALRHTSASLLIAQGVPLETVSRRLGHGDSRITKQIYLHLTDQLKKADEEAVSKAQILPFSYHSEREKEKDLRSYAIS